MSEDNTVWSYQYAFTGLELGLNPDDKLELRFDEDLNTYVFRISHRGSRQGLVEATSRLSWIFEYIAKKVKYGERPVV